MSSGSQSSDGGQKGPTPIAFNMHKGVQGYFHLEMPLDGDMSASRFKQNEYPLVQLAIRDQDQMDCLMRMKQLQHENILGLHFYDEATIENANARSIQAYIEPYSGCVSDVFDPEYFVNKETNLVPSRPFQQLVSGSLSALDHIFKNGLYHGNFAWNTTLYQQQKDGTSIAKLSNFEKKKNKSLLECQIGDCLALAHGLEEVSQFVRTEYPDYKPETCVLIDDLALRLRDVTAESLSMMKQHNEHHAFFWDGKRKRTFYAYELPAVWDKPAFLERFRISSSMPSMPWNALWKTDKLMKEMESYRQANMIKEYKFHELNDFFRFISGLYTHEIEFKKKAIKCSVDGAVHEKHPRLLLDLKEAIEADDDMELG